MIRDEKRLISFKISTNLSSFCSVESKVDTTFFSPLLCRRIRWWWLYNLMFMANNDLSHLPLSLFFLLLLLKLQRPKPETQTMAMKDDDKQEDRLCIIRWEWVHLYYYYCISFPDSFLSLFAFLSWWINNLDSVSSLFHSMKTIFIHILLHCL